MWKKFSEHIPGICKVQREWEIQNRNKESTVPVSKELRGGQISAPIKWLQYHFKAKSFYGHFCLPSRMEFAVNSLYWKFSRNLDEIGGFK